MRRERKPLAWLTEHPQTPPWSAAARTEAGNLLRALQEGQTLGLPHSRPMPSIGPRCHELRVRDDRHHWRIIYRIDPGEIVIAVLFAKATQATPKAIIDLSQKRFRDYDHG